MPLGRQLTMRAAGDLTKLVHHVRALGWWARASIALGVIGAALLAVSTPSAESVDASAIRRAIEAAMVASQQLPAWASAPASRPRRVSDDEWLQQSSAEFAQFYTGDVLARKIKTVQWAMSAAPRDTSTDETAGVRGIVIKSLTIDGSHATATARASVWLTYSQANPDGSPFHFHLIT